MTTLAATLGWTREIVSENCASISLDKVLVPNYCVCVFFFENFHFDSERFIRTVRLVTKFYSTWLHSSNMHLLPPNNAP